MDDRTEKLLADLLARRLSGAPTEDPGLPTEALRESEALERLARRMGQAGRATPPTAFMTRARGRLLHAIEATQPARPRPGGLPMRPRPLWAIPLVSMLVVGLAGTAGVTYATAAALPGDILFPAKAAFEQVALDLAPGPSARADLSLAITERRLSEGEQLASHGRWAQAGLALEAASGALDRSVKLLEGVQEARALDLLTGRLAGLLPRVEGAVALARGAPSTQMKGAAEMLTASGMRASEAGKHLGPQHKFDFPLSNGNNLPHPDKPKHTTRGEESPTSSKDKGHGSQPTRTPKKPTGAPK